MGSLLHPVGSQSASVYWRRRILVLVAFLAVLALLLYACSGSAKKKPPSPVASGTPSTVGSGTQSVVPPNGTGTSSVPASSGVSSSGGATGGTTGGATGGASSTGGVSGGASGGASGGSASTGGTAPGGTESGGIQAACQLTLALSSSQAAYINGDKPTFTATLFNKGTADCDVDVRPTSLVVTVFSGQDRIWSSADCGDGQQDLRAIAPGTSLTVNLDWSRLRSQPGCAGPQTPAQLGTYYAKATVTTGNGASAVSFESTPRTFELKSGS